jgi:hypothetical protein
VRKSLAVVFVVLAALIGYALAPKALRAQAGSVPFVTGQTLVLTFESGRLQHRCTVTLQHGDFLGCMRERTPGSDEREVWYNLRFVERVERRER